MAIETIGELSTEILAIVDDGSYDIDDVISKANKAIKEIAGKVLLPDLETDGTVNTVVSQGYLSLPADFHRNLFRCYSNTNKRKIKIYGSVGLLHRKFYQPDLSGTVVGVAVRGSQLHYQRIPGSAEELRIYYYKFPTLIEGSGGQPDCLPEHLVRPLMVNYCCKELFSLIEQDVNGSKPNTDKHDGLFRQAMEDLIAFVGPEAREPVEFGDEIGWDYL